MTKSDFPEQAPRLLVRVTGEKTLSVLEPAVTAVLQTVDADDNVFVVRATPTQRKLLERMSTVEVVA
jgi:hypothetical protein